MCRSGVTRCHGGVTDVSQKCHQVSPSVTEVSPRCQGDTEVSRCHRGVKVSPRCHEVSRRCHRGVIEGVTRCHRGVKFCQVLSYGCQNADTLTDTDQTCPCSGWRSCHTLRWDSTTKSTRGCEGRGGRLRLRLDSTSDSTRGFDGPRSCPAPRQAPYSHM